MSPVSYATYRTVFFRAGPNFASIYTLLQEFIFHRALKSKIAMIWMIISAAFVAAFPSWVSAMTGYNGRNDAFVKDATGNLVQLADFHYIEYVVHDWDRIGLTTDYYVTGRFDSSPWREAQSDLSPRKLIVSRPWE